MFIVKKQQLLCLSLMLLFLFLILSQSKSLSLAEENGHKGRFNKFRTRSSASVPATRTRVFRNHEKKGHGFKRNYAKRNGNNVVNRINGDSEKKEGEGDDIFDADKRRVHTGPNPLHNR